MANFTNGTSVCRSQMSYKNFEAVVDAVSCTVNNVVFVIKRPDGSSRTQTESISMYMSHGGNTKNDLEKSELSWLIGSYAMSIVVKYVDGTTIATSIAFTVKSGC